MFDNRIVLEVNKINIEAFNLIILSNIWIYRYLIGQQNVQINFLRNLICFLDLMFPSKLLKFCIVNEKSKQHVFIVKKLKLFGGKGYRSLRNAWHAIKSLTLTIDENFHNSYVNCMNVCQLCMFFITKTGENVTRFCKNHLMKIFDWIFIKLEFMLINSIVMLMLMNIVAYADA